MVTPLWILAMSVCFDCSNACWSVSSYLNLLLALSWSLKGSITLVVLNAYDTWFTNPNQDLKSVRFYGMGNSKLALRYFLHGFTVSFVISNPANSTSSWANRNLSGLRVIPCFPQTSSQLHVWKKLSSILLSHKTVSSTDFVFLGTSEVISLYLLVYSSLEAMYPCDAVWYL